MAIDGGTVVVAGLSGKDNQLAVEQAERKLTAAPRMTRWPGWRPPTPVEATYLQFQFVIRISAAIAGNTVVVGAYGDVRGHPDIWLAEQWVLGLAARARAPRATTIRRQADRPPTPPRATNPANPRRIDGDTVVVGAHGDEDMATSQTEGQGGRRLRRPAGHVRRRARHLPPAARAGAGGRRAWHAQRAAEPLREPRGRASERRRPPTLKDSTRFRSSSSTSAPPSRCARRPRRRRAAGRALKKSALEGGGRARRRARGGAAGGGAPFAPAPSTSARIRTIYSFIAQTPAAST